MEIKLVLSLEKIMNGAGEGNRESICIGFVLIHSKAFCPFGHGVPGKF